MSLIQCVKENNLNEVNRLIRDGVDVNAVDQEGRTALWWAANESHLEYPTALINAKADVSKANKYDRTPLHIASANGHVECVQVRRLRGGE